MTIIDDLIRRIPLRRREKVNFYKCIDCHIIILVTPGDVAEIGSDKWDLCERCKNRRNGFKGAINDRDIGVR